MKLDKRDKELFPKMLRFLKQNNYFHILLQHPNMKYFFIFLYRKDGEKALGSYIENVGVNSKFNLFQTALVKSAFSWMDSKEGAFYWINISEEWDERLKEIKKQK